MENNMAVRSTIGAVVLALVVAVAAIVLALGGRWRSLPRRKS
jgi:hypothetical protein